MEKLCQQGGRWILQIQQKNGAHFFMHILIIYIKFKLFILPLVQLMMVHVLIICTKLKYHQLLKFKVKKKEKIM